LLVAARTNEEKHLLGSVNIQSFSLNPQGCSPSH
jgi:hypothetical protein